VIEAGSGAELLMRGEEVLMPGRDGLKLSDEELDRRAREFFAQVRAEHPEEKAGRALNSAGDAAGEVGSDVLGWLFGGSSDNDASGDHSGD
jgi:hypothetical protein